LDEDRQRADMVQSDSLRKQVEGQATSVEEFLRGLEMKARVGVCDATTLDRIHQLIQKTNQFNLTTRRHNIDDLRRFMLSPQAAGAWLRLSDRYGDLGLVCVGIVDRVDERTWEIDTLLMSCRVMGRQVEDAFLSYLGELARQGGAQVLRGIFRPTAKNAPVKDFYAGHGFKEQSVDLQSDGQRVYEAELTPQSFPWPETIHRVGLEQTENASA